MAYIADVLNGTIDAQPDRISVTQYVFESSYVTQYLSRVVKDKALVVYQVLFHLSWFETGKGEIVVPWARVGSFIRSEQGNIIENQSTVKRRLPDLIGYKCIAVNRSRSSANEISVHLPSTIPACRQLMNQERQEAMIPLEDEDKRDYFSEPTRRLAILLRDGHACVYCTAPLSEEVFVLDHLLPVAKGGTNRKHNLVATCQTCNRRRSDSDPIVFLRENYRSQLLAQDEFLRQKEYIEGLLAEGSR